MDTAYICPNSHFPPLCGCCEIEVSVSGVLTKRAYPNMSPAEKTDTERTKKLRRKGEWQRERTDNDKGKRQVPNLVLHSHLPDFLNFYLLERRGLHQQTSDPPATP